MTKILIPLLVLAGLGLGLFLLISRRKVAIPENGSRVTVVILTAAATIAGALGTTACKKKPMPSCYQAVALPDAGTVPAGERSAILDKLHAEGKLGDEAYAEILTQIQKENWFDEKELGTEEKDAIVHLKQMNEDRIERLEKEKSWSVLEGQVDALLEWLASTGQPREYTGGFDAEKTTAAAGDLHARGHIDETTSRALATVLNNVFTHHGRSHSGRTCYKMSEIGFQKKGWKGKLLAVLESLADHEPTDEEYIEHLGVLATGVACLSAQDENVCGAGPSEGKDRVSMVRTLDLLIGLCR